MADKYSDLPDIEDGPQIFESSDVEENIISEVEGDQLDSDIDESTTKLGDVKQRFNRDFISGEITLCDFLGNISANLGSSGYKVRLVNETTDEKLARIARELEEIKLETDLKESGIENDDEVNRLVVVLEGQLNGREDVILNPYNTKIKELFKSEVVLKQKKSKGDIENRDAASKTTTSLTRTLEIESRINRIESILGEVNDSDSLSIQSQINELTRKANLVYNPEYHLKSLDDQIKRLNSGVEKYLSNRRLASIGKKGESTAIDEQSETENNKIKEIYQRIPDFDRMNSILPKIITRLKSLNVVHNELGGCITTITDFDKTLSELQFDIKKWDTSINDVNEKIDLHERQFEENKLEIEKWIKELESSG